MLIDSSVRPVQVQGLLVLAEYEPANQIQEYNFQKFIEILSTMTSTGWSMRGFSVSLRHAKILVRHPKKMRHAMRHAKN